MENSPHHNNTVSLPRRLPDLRRILRGQLQYLSEDSCCPGGPHTSGDHRVHRLGDLGRAKGLDERPLVALGPVTYSALRRSINKVSSGVPRLGTELSYPLFRKGRFLSVRDSGRFFRVQADYGLVGSLRRTRSIISRASGSFVEYCSFDDRRVSPFRRADFGLIGLTGVENRA